MINIKWPLMFAVINLVHLTQSTLVLDDIFNQTDLNSLVSVTIKGKVFPHNDTKDFLTWLTLTRISVNDGQYLGFIKKDGSFEINSVQSGSYVVEVLNPNYIYKSFRVDINTKGKIRARELNHIQPSIVEPAPYPLEFKSDSQYEYFEKRKNWSVINVLTSPFLIMMIFPIVTFLLFPYLISLCDTKAKKELENFRIDYEGPELSEMVTYLLKNRSAKKKEKETKKKH